MATIKTYEKEAKKFIKRYKELKPYRMQELMDTFFVKGARALDIGCASGRDIKHLKEKGYQVTGLDAVEEFVQHCKREFPDTTIIKGSLPTLENVADESYENILLCAVLMHLAGEDLIEAVSNIMRVTTPEGRILISIRPSFKEDEREEDGRLFSSIAPSKLINLFEGFGAKLLFHETTYESTHLGEKTWHNFVFEKVDLSKKSGIESIQEIIAKDKKDTSYKLALLRALNHIARYEQGSVHHHGLHHIVYIPLKRVAFYWLQFFYPLITSPKEVYQSQSHKGKIAIKKPILELENQYGSLPKILKAYQEGDTKTVDKALTTIATTIRSQPMKFIGDDHYGVFPYWSKKDSSELYDYLPDNQNGFIGVPAQIWHDLIFFNQWIEDSLVLHWARFSEAANKDENLALYVKLLSSPIEDPRSTTDIRNLFTKKSPLCIYSQKEAKDYQVDHMIPYFHWKNNDLWNLMPASSRLNLQKKDRIPTPTLIKKSKDLIISNWKLYEQNYPSRFHFQIGRAFGSPSTNWENTTFMAFFEMISRIESHKQIDSWEP